MLKRALVGAGLVVLLGAAGVYFFRPPGYAVNVPLAQVVGHGIAAPPVDGVLARLAVPAGVRLGRLAEGIEGARFLEPTPAGDLLVSQPRLGRIALLERDANGDGRADAVRTLVDGLDQPHGLDLHGGWLYVAEGGAIGRIRFDPAARATSGAFERIVTGLPKGEGHWTRTVRFGPDGFLYLSVGSSCNVCLETDARRAAITRYREDGSGEEIYATGLRNAVGFDWRPGTGELFATDNGRDLLGDDFPPCELDRVVKGGFYGWPFANGDRVLDPDYGKGHEAQAAASIPPAHAFRPHNAPLGITFLTHPATPAAFQGTALVALHGSWNRSKKDGYKVVSLHWSEDGAIAERDFVTGFERDDDVIGRPVDVAQGSDGAVYISDDFAGSIFRATFGDAPAGAAGASAAPGAPAAGDVLHGMPADEIARRQARGKTVYARWHCASCHSSAVALPKMKVKPLVNLRERFDLDKLDAWIRTPTPPMPTYPIRDEDRRSLAVYLLTTEESER